MTFYRSEGQLKMRDRLDFLENTIRDKLDKKLTPEIEEKMEWCFAILIEEARGETPDRSHDCEDLQRTRAVLKRLLLEAESRTSSGATSPDTANELIPRKIMNENQHGVRYRKLKGFDKPQAVFSCCFQGKKESLTKEIHWKDLWRLNRELLANYMESCSARRRNKLLEMHSELQEFFNEDEE